MSLSYRFGRRAAMKRSKSACARSSSTAVQAYSARRKLCKTNFYVDNGLTEKWLARLRVSSNTYTSSENFSQLSSLLDFFQRDTKNHGLAVS